MSKDEEARLRKMIIGYAEQTKKAQMERGELEAALELIRKADARAIKMWQEAHPGNDLVWPDRGKMIFWLLEKQHALDVAGISEALDAIDKIAEEDIAQGNPVTGAHHRAIQKFRKLLDDEAGSS